MDRWEATLTIKNPGETSTQLVITVEANSLNDAFIIAASKGYAMFAGTETGILSLSVSVIVPEP